MKCVECGTQIAELAPLCVRCGAPVAGSRSVAADPATGGLSGGLVAAAARDAGLPPARVRRGQPYYLVCLVFSVILYVIGAVGLIRTSLDSRPHTAMGWILIASSVGVFVSLVLVETGRNQFRNRQLAWGLVPILSAGFLAFVPFLWLALMRRQARDWKVLGVYLAGTDALVYIIVANFYNRAAWSATYVLMACLALLAAAQAVVAFRPDRPAR